jgi:hypothetical protein
MACEEAFRRYCSSSLVQEYDQMSPVIQQRLLDALISSQRDDLMQHHFHGGKILHMVPKLQCPLVRAILKLGVHPEEVVDEEFLIQ